MTRRAQISMEYIMLTGVVMVLFFIVSALLLNRLIEMNRAHQVQLTQQLGHIIENEINMAFISPPVYNRTATLPPILEGKTYSVRNGTGAGPSRTPGVQVSLDIGSEWRPATSIALPQADIRWQFSSQAGDASSFNTSPDTKGVRMETAHVFTPGGEAILVTLTELR